MRYSHHRRGIQRLLSAHRPLAAELGTQHPDNRIDFVEELSFALAEMAGDERTDVCVVGRCEGLTPAVCYSTSNGKACFAMVAAGLGVAMMNGVPELPENAPAARCFLILRDRA